MWIVIKKQTLFVILSVKKKHTFTFLLAHQWILCSEWVPSEWESKQLIKTSQSSTSNPHHSSPSLNILWSFINILWRFINILWSPSLIFFNFKPSLLAKKLSPYSIIMLLPEKKSIFCCLSHQNPPTYLFRAVLDHFSKRCLICADFSPDSDQTTFSPEEALLWIMDYLWFKGKTS